MDIPLPRPKFNALTRGASRPFDAVALTFFAHRKLETNKCQTPLKTSHLCKRRKNQDIHARDRSHQPNVMLLSPNFTSQREVPICATRHTEVHQRTNKRRAAPPESPNLLDPLNRARDPMNVHVSWTIALFRLPRPTKPIDIVCCALWNWTLFLATLRTLSFCAAPGRPEPSAWKGETRVWCFSRPEHLQTAPISGRNLCPLDSPCLEQQCWLRPSPRPHSTLWQPRSPLQPRRTRTPD